MFLLALKWRISKMKIIFLYISSLLFFSCNQYTGEKKQTITPEATMEYTGKFLRPSWINNTTIYEVNLRQFSAQGTLAAFAKELPRLKSMGMETLWFMPLTPIAQKNKKGILGSPYACSSYIAFNKEFGTLKEFAAFVKEAHQLGFKIIIDWVANHTGWDHEWTVLHPEYYLKDAATNNFKMASGMEDIIELDYSNPHLRKAMIEAMRFWVLNTGIDGFRCDLAFWVELDFWVEARTALAQNKNLFWLAETDPVEHPDYLQVFDAAYTWTWMHETKKYYEGNIPLERLDSVLVHYDTIAARNNIPLWFTTNHDENSWNGTEYEKYGPMALPLAVFSFTWNGIPLVYNGQEIPNKKRLAFFEKDTINWNQPYKLESFYHILSSLRKNNKALLAGTPKVTTYRINTTPYASQVFAFLKKNEEAEVFVILNLNNTAVNIPFDDKLLSGKFTDVFDINKNIDFRFPVIFNMEPWSYLVFEK